MSDLGTVLGATGIESAINGVWNSNTALAAAVPVNRLITGRVPPSEEMPYVRLEPEGGREMVRTNASLYSAVNIHFHIWSDTYDVGNAVAGLIQAAFASIAFNWGRGAVLDMKLDGPPVSRQATTPEIKAWETTVNFTCSTWQQRQD